MSFRLAVPAWIVLLIPTASPASDFEKDIQPLLKKHCVKCREIMDSECPLRRQDAALTAAELDAVRRCVNRGAPLGTGAWVAQTAERLGLEASLRPRGRPRKDGAGSAGDAP